MSKVRWTPEMVAFLKENYSTMLTREIAEHLGGVTRHAVIGRAHREGLRALPRRRVERISEGLKIMHRKKRRPSPPLIPQPPAEPPKPRPMRRVKIEDLEPWHCREIVKEQPVAKYCGQIKQDGSSYCPEHHAKNHTRVMHSRVEKYYGGQS